MKKKWMGVEEDAEDTRERWAEPPGVMAGALWVPRLSEWRPAVLVGDDVYVGHETFNTSDEAIAVAKGRGRARVENGGG